MRRRSPIREKLAQRVRGTVAERPLRTLAEVVSPEGYVVPLLRPRMMWRTVSAVARERRARSDYTELSDDELRATKRSDTVFVFGSGRSLCDLDAREWERIAEHDTVGFSQFARQRWVPVTHFVVGEIPLSDAFAFGELLRDNPCLDDAVFVVQRGWLAQDANEMVGFRQLPAGARVFRFTRTSRSRYSPPSRSFDAGLVHGWNSAISVTNFAIAAGWRRIVLTGVDLYNKEYFWLAPGETRGDERPGLTAHDPFPTAPQIVHTLGRWRTLLEPEGIELLVYNPRSLLADVMPVYSWDER